MKCARTSGVLVLLALALLAARSLPGRSRNRLASVSWDRTKSLATRRSRRT
jgi:hypothetical protein